MTDAPTLQGFVELTAPATRHLELFDKPDPHLIEVREMAERQLKYPTISHILAHSQQSARKFYCQLLTLKCCEQEWTCRVFWTGCDAPDFAPLYRDLKIPNGANVEAREGLTILTWHEIEVESKGAQNDNV